MEKVPEKVLVSPGAAMALASGASIYAAAIVASSKDSPEPLKWAFLVMPIVFILATLAIENFHKKEHWLPWTKVNKKVQKAEEAQSY